VDACGKVKTCQWWALCGNDATKVRHHPVLGDVPICDRCNVKVERLENKMKPKRYVVMDAEGPTPFETDHLQEAVDHIVMWPDRFVWDRQKDRRAAQ
jgi:hypothetical protein